MYANEPTLAALSALDFQSPAPVRRLVPIPLLPDDPGTNDLRIHLATVTTSEVIVGNSLMWTTPVGAFIGGLAIEWTHDVVLVHVVCGILKFLIPVAFAFSPLGHAEKYLRGTVPSVRE